MRTVPVLKERGHLLVPIGERRALVDTGSPFSLAEEPFELFGHWHCPPTECWGVTPRLMSALAGMPIHIAIGCDILCAHTIRIRGREGLLDEGDDVPEGPIGEPMSTLRGTPIFSLRLGGRPVRALFDTGAHISYIRPEMVAGQPPVDERCDFHPFCGRFRVPIYTVSVALDGEPLMMEVGVLPDPLRMMFHVATQQAGAALIVGTALLDVFDCTISWPHRRISWRRAVTA
ncbi:MAG: hypothetical protein N2652_08685 [Kiritimatiellae bacterium]|nr:hypothetical protein [Kiritimatiellia bacterium]